MADFVLEGGDVNIQDSGGDTLLHIAAKEGKEELLDTLLAYGADTQIRNTKGETPMDELEVRSLRRRFDALQCWATADAVRRVIRPKQ